MTAPRSLVLTLEIDGGPPRRWELRQDDLAGTVRLRCPDLHGWQYAGNRSAVTGYLADALTELGGVVAALADSVPDLPNL